MNSIERGTNVLVHHPAGVGSAADIQTTISGEGHGAGTCQLLTVEAKNILQ